MIPNWLGVIALVFVAIFCLAIVAYFSGTTISSIKEKGLKYFLKEIIIEEWRLILFVIVLFAIFIIASLYTNQVLGR